MNTTEPMIRLTAVDIRAHSKESELDALIALRASADYCDRREKAVSLWKSGYSPDYDAYIKGTLDAIKEYRAHYMSTAQNAPEERTY